MSTASAATAAAGLHQPARKGPRRIVYFGTPRISVPPLRALHAAGHRVSMVVSRPPRRRSRRGDPIPAPAAAAAGGLGLPVVHDLGDDALLEAAEEADLGVVVAYGALIGVGLLERLAMVNLHFSLLPRWRGAAPVQRAILAGDTETGVCLIDVDAEIDRGGVYRRESTLIGAQETASELQDRLCGIGTGMLVDALSEGLGEPAPQSGIATRARKIEPAELRIDWHAPAEHIHRLVRVGGAWTTFHGKRLKILGARCRSLGTAKEAATTEAAAGVGGIVRAGSSGVAVATGDGELELRVVQAAGRAAVAAAAWRHGARVGVGDRFGL